MLEVLRSGRLSLGPILDRFERDFERRLGVRHAVAVSSGTSALHLAVRALGWGEGDEVITSPLSFVASSNCLLYEGAVPRFCDVDPETLRADPKTMLPKLHGALLKNEQDVHLFERLAFLSRSGRA